MYRLKQMQYNIHDQNLYNFGRFLLKADSPFEISIWFNDFISFIFFNEVTDRIKRIHLCGLCDSLNKKMFTMNQCPQSAFWAEQMWLDKKQFYSGFIH